MKTILKITVLSAFFLVLVGGLVSCNEIENKELPPNQISSNLAQKGSIDTELIIGEWDIVRFAYTPDGKTISNVSSIYPPMKLGIRNEEDLTPYFFFGETPLPYLFGPWTFGPVYIFYSTSGNLIDHRMSSTRFSQIHWTREGLEILTALVSAHSFVIIEDNLIIHFVFDDESSKTEFDSIRNSNLLILKKR